MKKSTMPLLALAAGLAISGAGQAALIDRGGGLLYDDVLNVTWLQDANYAVTSGYDADGRMTWNDAMTWAANLSYYDSVRGVTYDDWRLPTLAPVNGTAFQYAFSFDGSTDWGFNIGSPSSELAYMYYVNLGLMGAVNPDGTIRTDWGIHGNGTTGGQADVGLVKNLQSGTYWVGVEYAPSPLSAWAFSDAGAQTAGGKDLFNFNAWAVRPGDVAAPIPEPQTYALMLAGLGMMGWAARRRRG